MKSTGPVRIRRRKANNAPRLTVAVSSLAVIWAGYKMVKEGINKDSVILLLCMIGFFAMCLITAIIEMRRRKKEKELIARNREDYNQDSGDKTVLF